MSCGIMRLPRVSNTIRVYGDTVKVVQVINGYRFGLDLEMIDWYNMPTIALTASAGIAVVVITTFTQANCFPS